MMKVTITNLLSIAKLEFDLPEPGIWVLAGRNGAGKSSLLAALWRIGSSEAFRKSFPSSSNERLDSFAGTEIKYTIGAKEVAYRRTAKKWPCTPRNLALKADDFGFANVLFIGADADRVSPTPKDFDPQKNRGVSEFIKQGLRDVFDTKKFDELKVVNISRGRMTPAYILPTTMVGGKRRYFSEKNFSLGELCVLKMLAKLDGLGEQKALILIDEMDMALHPVAQIGLFKFLQNLSQVKGHTVIISSHSPAIIKEISLQNLIYLDPQNDGAVKVIRHPDRGAVLHGVSGDIHLREGARIYCEDEMAKKLFLAAHTEWRKNSNNDAKSFSVMAVGSWTTVLDHGRSDGNDGNKHFSVLDADVSVELVKNHVAQASSAFNWCRLPVTPELCVAIYCKDRNKEFLKLLHEQLLLCAGSSFGQNDVGNALQLPSEVQAKTLSSGTNDKPARDSAKNYQNNVVVGLSKAFAISKEDIRKALLHAVMEAEFANSCRKDKWKAFFGKIYNKLG